MLEIVRLTLGPVATNAYLIADSDTKSAAVIDPAWEGERIIAEAHRRQWKVRNIWLTHAHFDHFGGSAYVADNTHPPPPVGLHPADAVLWRMQGGANLFGFRIDPGPEPSVDFFNGQTLRVGKYTLEVRHAPGHTPGHVVFYCQAEQVVFCGDVIFSGSIGRTDLPGGDYDTLLVSIREQILTLPDATRLLSGHGPETTVGRERDLIPFL